jgi:AcrR family transcriptional regulator
MSKGVEKVSMEDIAAKAELSKATLYLYFPSKEALLNEICEQSARGFMGHLAALQGAAVSGMDALKFLWQGYVKMFGDSDEMLLVFRIRNYLANWLPLDWHEKQQVKSPCMDSILTAMRSIIEQCKADGVFDPALNSARALRLLLRLFSESIESASCLPVQERNSPSLIREMTSTFQIVIRGFAKEGTGHALLDIGSFA